MRENSTGQLHAPMQDRARETRDNIINAAAEVFGQNGYQGASLSQISQRAGVSQGAMYFHFKSKEQIALAVAHEQHVRLRAAISGDINPDHPLEGAIRASRRVVQLLGTDAIVQASFRLSLESDALSEPVRQFVMDWTDLTVSNIQRCVEDGQLTCILPVSELAQTLIASCIGGLYTASDSPTENSLALSVKNVWVVFLSATAATDARAELLAAVDTVFS